MSKTERKILTNSEIASENKQFKLNLSQDCRWLHTPEFEKARLLKQLTLGDAVPKT